MEPQPSPSVPIQPGTPHPPATGPSGATTPAARHHPATTTTTTTTTTQPHLERGELVLQPRLELLHVAYAHGKHVQQLLKVALLCRVGW
jgi:hypothetical protein